MALGRCQSHRTLECDFGGRLRVYDFGMKLRSLVVTLICGSIALTGCGGDSDASKSGQKERASESNNPRNGGTAKSEFVIPEGDITDAPETREVTLESASANFAAAFPDLAAEFGGDDRAAAEAIEPSQALTDAFTVWDQLSSEQQASVREALRPDATLAGSVVGDEVVLSDEAPGSDVPAPAGQILPMRTQAEQALFELRDIKVELQRRTGFTLTKGFSVVVDPTELPRAETTAWAVAVAIVPVIEIPPRWLGMNRTDCVIFVGQRAFNSSELQRRSVLAHELFHCMQHEAMGSRTVAEWSSIPAWVTEGTAAWVGEKFVNGSGTSLARSWWDIYLGGNTFEGSRHGFTLFRGNGYPAIGYFEFLNANGVDMWTRALNVLVGNSTNSSAFAFFNRGVDATVLARWGAGAAQQSGWPAPWRAPMIGSYDFRRPPKQIPIRIGSSSNDAIGLGANALYRYNIDSSVEVLELRVTGQAHLGFNGADEQTLTTGTTLRWCVKGTECLCASGTPPNLNPGLIPATPGVPLTLALAAITGPASAVAVGYSTQDLCDRCPPAPDGGGRPGRHLRLAPSVEPECASPPPASPDCIVGTWSLDANQLLANLPPEAQQGGTITGFTGALVLTFGADGAFTTTFDDVKMATVAPIAGADGVEEDREQQVILAGNVQSRYSYDGTTLQSTGGTRNISGKVTLDIPGAGKFDFDFPAPAIEAIINGFGVAGGGTLAQAAQCSPATLTITGSSGGPMTLSRV